MDSTGTIYRVLELCDMPRLVLPANDLFNLRDGEVRHILREVVADPQRLQVRGQKDTSGGRIIAASDAFSSGGSPRERLFATTSKQLYGQYYEIWAPDSQGRLYHL